MVGVSRKREDSFDEDLVDVVESEVPEVLDESNVTEHSKGTSAIEEGDKESLEDRSDKHSCKSDAVLERQEIVSVETPVRRSSRNRKKPEWWTKDYVDK